jgi:hypothetical protein
MRDIDLIWVKRERKYFCKQGWTAGINPTPHSTNYTLLNPKFLSDSFEKASMRVTKNQRIALWTIGSASKSTWNLL